MKAPPSYYITERQRKANAQKKPHSVFQQMALQSQIQFNKSGLALLRAKGINNLTLHQKRYSVRVLTERKFQFTIGIGPWTYESSLTGVVRLKVPNNNFFNALKNKIPFTVVDVTSDKIVMELE